MMMKNIEIYNVFAHISIINHNIEIGKYAV
jgi:hypothetical protein